MEQHNTQPERGGKRKERDISILQLTNSQILWAEGFRWTLVKTEQSIPVSEDMTKIEIEFRMVHMMVRWSADSQELKQRVPRVRVFTVNEHEIVGVNHAKRDIVF